MQDLRRVPTDRWYPFIHLSKQWGVKFLVYGKHATRCRDQKLIPSIQIVARERKILKSKKQKTEKKAKNKKQKETGREASLASLFFFPLSIYLFYRAPLSERLEQDKRPIVEPPILQSSDQKIQPANPTPPLLLAWVLLSHVSLTNDGGAHFLFHIFIFRISPPPQFFFSHPQLKSNPVHPA